MTALLYHHADQYHDATPVEINRALPSLTFEDAAGYQHRYVLEAWASPELWGGALYREVAS